MNERDKEQGKRRLRRDRRRCSGAIVLCGTLVVHVRIPTLLALIFALSFPPARCSFSFALFISR